MLPKFFYLGFMVIVKFLSVVAFFGSVAWMVHSPDYEPALACITSLSACIAVFLLNRRKEDVAQAQEVSGGSVAIQAGRNVTLETPRSKGKGIDA